MFHQDSPEANNTAMRDEWGAPGEHGIISRAIT